MPSLRIALSCCLLVLFGISPVASQTPTSFFDHFPGPALPPRWVPLTSGGGTVTVQDSYVELNAPAGNDASAMYYSARLDKSRSQLWVFALSNDGAAFPQWWVTLINSASPPAVVDLNAIVPMLRARVSLAQSGGTKGVLFDCWNAANARRQWDGGANVWTIGRFAVSPIREDDYYLVALEIDGPGNRWRMLSWGKRTPVAGSYSSNQGLKLFAVTDWVPWSSQGPTDDLWLVIGDQLNSNNQGRLRVEWVRYDDGPKQDAWLNGSPGSGGYNIKHWYGYGAPSGAAEFLVPQDRTTVAVNEGPPGSWDFGSVKVKDQFVVLGGNTYYLFYNNSQIGLATATQADGPWTKDPGNPILAAVPGTEEEIVIDAGVVKDLTEADPNKVWKMIYTGFGADAKHRLFLATAPAPSGAWTRQGKIMDVGPLGAIDELGVARARPVWHNNQWYVFHSVRSAAATGFWSVSYATGPDFASLTKSNQALIPRKSTSAQDLTANLSGRIVTVVDTSGFDVDGFVGVRRSASQDNDFAVSRVRSILGPTSLELYHGLDGFLSTGPAQIIQEDSTLVKNEVADVLNLGSTWFLYVTNFSGARGESLALLTAPDVTGPYTWFRIASPPATLASWDNSTSNENISFVHFPVDRGPIPPDTTPPAISGIATVNLGTTSATITWVTGEGATSQVEYGVDTTYGNLTAADPALLTAHSQDLTGLSPDTLYHYRVISGDAAGNVTVSADATFMTTAVVPLDTVPPQVAITLPADGAVVLGKSVAVSASASDDVAVVGVQFQLNGVNLGGEVLAQPYSIAWDTTTPVNGACTLTAVARDAAGNLTTTAPVSVTVQNNYALVFDGADDVVIAPSQPPPIPLSLSMWMKPASLGENNSGHLFSIRDDADNNPNVQLRLGSGNKLRWIALFDNAGQLSIGAWDTPVNSVVLNVLQHVAVAYDGSSPANDPLIFVNGVAQPLTQVATPVGVIRTDATTWRIGNSPALSATFLGTLDEVRVYNRLLTQTEVLVHYNNGQILPGQPEPGLVAGWHFDEKMGTVGFDYSGKGNHALLINGPLWVLF